MKTAILTGAILLGLFVGLIIGIGNNNAITGAATANCFVNNEPCVCEKDYCLCGEQKVPESYCRTENFNNAK